MFIGRLPFVAINRSRPSPANPGRRRTRSGVLASGEPPLRRLTRHQLHRVERDDSRGSTPDLVRLQRDGSSCEGLLLPDADDKRSTSYPSDLVPGRYRLQGRRGVLRGDRDPRIYSVTQIPPSGPRGSLSVAGLSLQADIRGPVVLPTVRRGPGLRQQLLQTFRAAVDVAVRGERHRHRLVLRQMCESR